MFKAFKQIIRTILIPAAFLFSANASFAVCELEQLANPSFEVGATNQFNGWNQFGVVLQSTTLVDHGNRSLALTGLNNGNLSLSAAWQKQTSKPNDVWEVKARVGHEAASALQGPGIRGIINIEWRDAADNLISFESFDVITESTPQDSLQTVVLTSQPAPAGTTSMHLLLGLLQTTAQEPGVAVFDSIFLRETTGPQQADSQWDDFPGGRTLNFGGKSWRIKGPGVFGPGPNAFSDSTDQVWVDSENHLHMRIRNSSGVWYSSEITTEEVLGYGDYQFTTIGRIDALASNVVFGFFHWQYPLCFDGGNPWNLHNEVDVEISRWGNPADVPAQFIVQPFQVANNGERFDLSYSSDTELTTFAYRWFSDRIEFRAWKGDTNSELPGNMIHSWVYTGPYIPSEDIARMHMNFWQFQGPPDDGLDQEIVITDFVFIPEGSITESSAFSVPAIGAAGLIFMSIIILIVGVRTRASLD